MVKIDVEEAFALALQNHQNNNFKIAENLYKEILEKNPNHFKSNFLLGTLLAQSKKFDEAKKFLLISTQIEPNNAHTHNNLGNIFKELKDHKEALNSYEKTIHIDPNFVEAHSNLGVVLEELGEYQKAISHFQKAIQINPNFVQAYSNLGVVFGKLGEYQKSLSHLNKAIQIQPNYAEAYNNLGMTLNELKEFKKAKDCYEKAIEIKPNYAAAHNSFGNVLKKLGEHQKAIKHFQKAIQIKPNFVESYNNLGLVFDELGEHKKAIDCYKKAIEINPNHPGTYWNLHSSASDIDEALTILRKLYDIDNQFTKAKIMISALKVFKGNSKDFNDLVSSVDSNHPYTRSIKWVFSLPKTPKIFFNRWDFFNAVFRLADKSRPFYEFGVWQGISFQHLIKTFKKGFGFDTFTGLPEDWHDEPAGTYSNFGSIPKIAGGEFVVGKFENTLPKFFSQKRPLASIINFDADLYSSTLCALNYSNKVIDEKSILIFDEFLMNEKWEEDEYKALNEFCDKLSISYDVLAVSFFSKQVAIRLKK